MRPLASRDAGLRPAARLPRSRCPASSACSPRATSRGQHRSMGTTRQQVPEARTTGGGRFPKLTVRVRFPSPAPHAKNVATEADPWLQPSSGAARGWPGPPAGPALLHPCRKERNRSSPTKVPQSGLRLQTSCQSLRVLGQPLSPCLPAPMKGSSGGTKLCQIHNLACGRCHDLSSTFGEVTSGT